MALVITKCCALEWMAPRRLGMRAIDWVVVQSDRDTPDFYGWSSTSTSRFDTSGSILPESLESRESRSPECSNRA